MAAVEVAAQGVMLVMAQQVVHHQLGVLEVQAGAVQAAY